MNPEQKPLTIKEKIRKAKIAKAVFLISILLVLIFAILNYFDLKYGFLKNIGGGIFKTEITSFSGKLLDPINEKGVKDVDVVIEEKSIRTDDSGFFSFDGVKEKSIKITHPLLTRAIEEKILDNEFFVYFDTDMYNTLVQYVNLEARSKYSDIYDSLVPEKIKSSTSSDIFIKDQESIFNPNNINDQTLVIGKTKIEKSKKISKYGVFLDRTIVVDVFNGESKATYYLTKEGNSWKVVK